MESVISKYIQTMESSGRKLYEYRILSKTGRVIFSHSVWEYPNEIDERVKTVCNSMKGGSYRIVEVS